MGLDYIRSAAGKPYVKRWAKGLNGLKTPSLIDVHLTEECRTVTASLAPGCAMKPGDAFLVQFGGTGDLVVLEGHRQIAQIVNAPAAHHGVAVAAAEPGQGQRTHVWLP
jgi:hypothetical protein